MSPLLAEEIAALRDALDDEYQAWATYDQVIADFGDVQPFVNIHEAERRHIEALSGLFSRYHVSMPANPWPGRVPRFESIRQAYEAAVAGEVANAALYDRLLAATQRADILAVFRRLREASEERHLRAFRRCVERGGAAGRGPAWRRRGSWG
jgi:rubrerythrin